MVGRRLTLVGALAAFLVGATIATAATPVLRTPGYRGVTKRVATKAPTAPAPVELSANGTRPDVIVDDAGTAHIVWNETTPGAADTTRYCRVPRGTTACDSDQRLVPPLQNVTSANFAAASADSDGPEVVAVNDQVVVLSRRYPFGVSKPGDDGSNSDTTVYLWTSDDGGRTFVGPGVAGIKEIGGGAAVFGPARAPSIGTITDTVTGGVTFSALQAGRLTLGGALLATGDFGRAGITTVDERPVVAYESTSGATSFVRRWSGAGDPNDAATWEPPQPVDGGSPSITTAGGRPLLLTATPTGAVRMVLRDLASGAATPVPGSPVGGQIQALGLPDGAASVVWKGRDAADTASGIWRQAALTPGRAARATAATLVSGVEPQFLAAAATADGGGFAVGDTGDKRILLSAFGSRAATRLPGLGSLVAGGNGVPPPPPLGPDTVVDCQRVKVGAVEGLLPDGCFLNAAAGGAKVTEGTLRLNGLEIVPDANVQILVNPRARTIDTTGRVSVVLKAPGVPEITLFRGELHLKLSGKGIGDSLLSFADGLFKPDILGFPVGGGVDVKLTDAGVRIPIELELPAAFGGVRGAVELVADNTRGLVLDSLELEADSVPLGPVLLRRLVVQYKASGGTTTGDCLRPPTSGSTAQPNEWAGVFELELPPPNAGPKLCGSIRFGGGSFRAATFRIDLPYPGIVLFPGVSILSLGGGLTLDPLEVVATVRVGMIPATAQTAVVNVDGRVTLRLDAPITVRGDAAVSVTELGIGRGTFTISAVGYASMALEAGLAIDPFRIQGRISGFIDGPREEFAIAGRNEICVSDECIPGGEVVLSTKGAAICAPGPIPPFPRGLGYRWKDGEVDVWPLECDTSAYQVPDTRAANAVEHAASGEVRVPVSAGATSVAFRVRAEGGGVPDVELVAPDGRAVTPDLTYPDVRRGALYLGVRSPAAGAWTVRARPGGALIAEVASSRGRPPAAVLSARVTGTGRTRTLRYRARIAEGQTITFAERGAAGARVLGPARGADGAVSFTPGPGPGGRRQIVALTGEDGLVRREAVVGTYVAPAPPALGRATGLGLRRAGRGVQATWTPGANAAAQIVTVRAAGGRAVTRVVGAGVRRLAVAGVAPGSRVTLGVTAVGTDGRRTAAARLVARPSAR